MIDAIHILAGFAAWFAFGFIFGYILVKVVYRA